MPDPPPIDRAFFRETGDGTTVFFPWGLPHRGYQLPSEGARKKASRAASMLVSSTIAIGTWAAYALQPLLESRASKPAEILSALAAPGGALALVIFSYWLWASRFVEGFPESSLRVSREVRLREAAELASPRKVVLIGVSLGSLSALLIWLQPHAWWLGLLGLLLGMGMLYWAVLLQRAAADTRG
jgi:hypothetical protein